MKQLKEYRFEIDKIYYKIIPYSNNIMRCICSKNKIQDSSFISIENNKESCLFSNIDLGGKDNIKLYNGELKLEISTINGNFSWSYGDKNLLNENGKELTEIDLVEYSKSEDSKVTKVKTVDGERNFVSNLKEVVVGKNYRGKLKFTFDDDESIHGFGQGEDGIYNYRGQTQYLYQHNMKIPIPFFVSTNNYGILFDCGSLMTFNDDARGSYVYLDSVPRLDYYFIFGEDIDSIISSYRDIAGKASLLPKWALGYFQSKEKYNNQEELLNVALEYKKRDLPIDCIVQDWEYWEDNKWGEKHVDRTKYPDISKMNQILKDNHIHSMISIWPNMNDTTDDFREFSNNDLLLLDGSTYDAFDEKARKIYWNQIYRELFTGGFSSLWCDSTEPFSGPDWNGEFKREPWQRFELVGNELKKFLRADRANLFPLFHAKGISENWLKENSGKRVVNLTRSGYTGIQKYGAILWSGDITASWDTLTKQVAEALNMGLSGIPYWTFDIGGFFTVNKNWKNRGCGCSNDPSPKWFWKGDYENGINDIRYRELYTRWFQVGSLLPIFRSHGTDTPREIWNFGEEGGLFYESLKKSLKLRYRLIPYIYSLMGKVWLNNMTIMRSLLFDFPEDIKAKSIQDEFMLGKNILVCPVLKGIYKEKDIEEIDKTVKKKIYLPKNTRWIKMDDNKLFEGGQFVILNVRIDEIPLFVKEGSIIPMEKELKYAEEIVDTPFEIHIFGNKSCSYSYYEDKGDGNEYESGEYNLITMAYDCTRKIFSIGNCNYNFKNTIRNRKCTIFMGEERKDFEYKGQSMTINL